MSSLHNRSQSRGRHIVPGSHGLGNVHESSPSEKSEAETREHSVPRGRGTVRNVVTTGDTDSSQQLHDGALHSTGRGGVANITSLRSPSVESPHPHDRLEPESELISVGRGGAGNIRSRSRSQARTLVEVLPHPHPSNVISTGRGGVGNIRSRSQSQLRADENKHHSSAHPGGPEWQNKATHEDSDSVTRVKPDGNKVHKTGIEGLLHKVIHHDT